MENKIIVAEKDLVSAELSGEAVILNLKTGYYFGLNAIGAEIWSMLQKPMLISDICNSILAEYDVAPDRCEKEIIDLIQQLFDNGLIEMADAPTT